MLLIMLVILVLNLPMLWILINMNSKVEDILRGIEKIEEDFGISIIGTKKEK